ncbi:MAG: leucyl aminopeptidase [Chloroflexota bacterium]
MEIKIIIGDITQTRAGAIVLGIFADVSTLEDNLAKVDEVLGGAITGMLKQGEIKGKLHEITLIHSLNRLPAERVVILGLGNVSDLTLDKVRGAFGGACRYLRQKWVDNIATIIPGAGTAGITADGAAQAITEGALLGTYSFRRHMTREAEYSEIKELTLVAAKQDDLPAVTAGYRKGKILAAATNLARDMVNEPSNYQTPADMAEKAVEIAGSRGLKITVMEREKMQELGMGGILGVAQGSSQPPKFIILEYHGRDSSDVDLALVGKGITFDSGGISIKPSQKMGEMKGDMAGGAAVMAAISAIADLKLRINVTALIPATENLPGGTAFKPGDILTAMNGKTMEIITTDAEGRLILADALSYAGNLKPRAIVDLATLTGAMVVALGDNITGAFTNNQDLLDTVMKAGTDVGETIWQMPMFDAYKELIKSDVADIKNSGGRAAGSITAAQFLEEFVGNTPWVHLDIAGTFMTDKEKDYQVKGATGVPVRTMVRVAELLAG